MTYQNDEGDLYDDDDDLDTEPDDEGDDDDLEF